MLFDGSAEADSKSEDPNQTLVDAVPRITKCLDDLCKCDEKERIREERT